MRCFGFS